MKTNVPIGITTQLGWGTAVLALVPLIVKAIEEGSASFAVGGPEKWLAIFGIVIGAITQIGRYVQAAIKAKAGQPH